MSQSQRDKEFDEWVDIWDLLPNPNSETSSMLSECAEDSDYDPECVGIDNNDEEVSEGTASRV